MRDLFQMDLHDYNPEGRVFSRPSVRAIIHRENKILLVYSKKYDYYKFPGGGIEAGEDHKSALIREVKEETGFELIPHSMKEYGRVLRRHKDSLDEAAIFEQENFYYFADVKEQTGERNLDDYEAEEEFTPVWMEPVVASRYNLYGRSSEGGDQYLIERDAKVMDMADIEIRKQNRHKHEEEYIQALGNPVFAKMLHFVEESLNESATEDIIAKADISYSRFEHTKRVLGWAKRLYDMSDCKDCLRYEDIMIATIFHDIGKSIAQKHRLAHAAVGADMTREYLKTHDYEESRIDFICSLIAAHSDKELMKTPDIDPNLILLMEADLLDDTGALGIVMDCMITEARNKLAHFSDCLDHIMRYTYRIQKNNPMVTKAGRQLWEEKTRIVTEFAKALKQDVELSEGE